MKLRREKTKFCINNFEILETRASSLNAFDILAREKKVPVFFYCSIDDHINARKKDENLIESTKRKRAKNSNGIGLKTMQT